MRREIDASDLRRHRLHLTEAGRGVMSAGMAILAEAFGTRLARITRGEQGDLQALLERMA